MRIIVVTSEYGESAGGLALTCNQLYKVLASIGHEISIEMSLNHDSYFAIDGGYDCDLGYKLRYAVHLKELEKKYVSNPPDLLIAYGAGVNGYFTYLLSKKIKTPYFLVLCGSDINISYASPKLFIYNELCVSNANKVIGLSYELVINAQIFDNKIFHDKYHIVPNAYFYNNNPIYKKLDKNKPIIFYVASTFLSEKKGIGNLIISFRNYIKKSGRKDILKLYGKIDRDIELKYNSLINEQMLDDNVIVCGYLNRDALIDDIANNDVYIQFSPFEGCCNAVGEAIHSGKFVILSDTGYFSERLMSKYPKLILPSLNPEMAGDFFVEYVNYISANDIRPGVYNYLKNYLSPKIVKNIWTSLLNNNRVFYANENIKPINEFVMFHDISNSFTGIDYPAHAFNELVEIVHQKGYRFCSFREYLATSFRDNLIVCTFDDAYENVYKYAFPMMEKYGFTGTVFVCPDLISKRNDWNHRDNIVRFHMSEKMLHVLKDSGWEIGSHGLGHYILTRLSQTELENTFISSREALSKLFGYDEIKTFCYPYGEHREYIRKLVSKYYDAAFSVNVGGCNLQRDRFQLTRIVPEELKKIMEKV